MPPRHPQRAKAYFYWAALGPLGAHAFYCQRPWWASFELSLALLTLFLFLFSGVDFNPLFEAALTLDPALQDPFSLILVDHPLALKFSSLTLLANTAIWILDAYLITVWTSENEAIQ